MLPSELSRSVYQMRFLTPILLLITASACAPENEPNWMQELVWAKELPEGFLTVSMNHQGSFGGQGGPGFLMIEFRGRNKRPDAIGTHGSLISFRDTKEYEGVFSVQMDVVKDGTFYRLEEKILGRCWLLDTLNFEITSEK